jgi:Protein of unknown function (DUF3723)
VEHHIAATIDPRQFDEAFETWKRSEGAVRKDTSEPPELLFPSRTSLRCLYGLHRVEAAKQLFQYPFRWWTVALYDEGDTPLAFTCVELTLVQEHWQRVSLI